MSNNFWRSQSGQTLLELVVVVGVSVLVIGALVFATVSSLRNAQFSKNQTLATKLAQERIERVRTGRDRNWGINMGLGIPVSSWDGNSSAACAGNSLIKEDSIWCYDIPGNCDRLGINNICYYFKLDPSSGVLTNIGTTTFPEIQAERVSPFRIAVTLSDDPDDYQKAKKVTAIVKWTDFSGDHESRLTTILRRL